MKWPQRPVSEASAIDRLCLEPLGHSEHGTGPNKNLSPKIVQSMTYDQEIRTKHDTDLPL